MRASGVLRRAGTNLAERLAAELPRGMVHRNVSMAKLTTYRVGGLADVVLVPRSIQELSEALSLLWKVGAEYVVLGRGSNVLVSDRGIREPVVLTTRLVRMGGLGDRLWSEAGVECSDLATVAAELGLTGLEFFYRLPGSVGGALFMNARAFGQEVSQVARRALVVRPRGGLETVELAPEDFAYKRSPFMGSDGVLAKVWWALEPGTKEEITARMEANASHRERNGESMYPSCGCVFKNPPGQSAGRLIDECGLKGKRFGGAWVSARHGNFIHHGGSATAAEIRTLMERIRQEVADRTGVELDYEVRFVGDWGAS